MKKFLRTVFFGATIVAFAVQPLSLAAQTQALTFTPSGVSGNNNDQSVGWQFNVLAGITVNGLSWWDDGAPGINAAGHTVGIWAPGGALLTSVLIPGGTAAPLNAGYRTFSISNIFLGIGSGYIVGGQNFANSTDLIQANVTSQTTHPSIQFAAATFSGIGGFQRPDQFSVATTGFYGPGFTIGTTSIVPEPGTYALMAFGLAGLALASRRRSA